MSFTSLLRNPFGKRSDFALGTSTGSEKIDTSSIPSDVRRMLKEHRYFQVLFPNEGVTFDENSIQCARAAVEEHMSIVPEGQVWLTQETAEETVDGGTVINGQDPAPTHVSSFYMDRLAVTNADYERFVKVGGYTNASYWPEDILPTVLQFVDQTGKPGPRFWHDGKPNKDQMDHPVVGICWYEANAYARWIGKQLPTTQQWQRAGTWGRSPDGSPAEVKYPWGNSFDPAKANLWVAGIHRTVPVTDFESADTTNGVRQLIGNVWEWVNNQYAMTGVNGVAVQMPEPMAEIRGGAFDSYFRSQATCQFRSGKSISRREHNIGFRCCRAIESSEQESTGEEI